MSRKRRTSDAPPAEAATAGASVEDEAGEEAPSMDGAEGGEVAPAGESPAVEASSVSDPPSSEAPAPPPETNDAPPAEAAFSIEGGSHSPGEDASFSR